VHRTATITLAGVLASAAGPVPAADDGPAAVQGLGCIACHKAEGKLVGPSYRAVAERYGGDRDKILAVIEKSVAEGASGGWSEVTGGVHMPPQPNAEGKTNKLKAIAEWIAGMAE
jgi:cytochrome c